MVEVLTQLDALGADERKALTGLAEPAVLGGGRTVGTIEPIVQLRRR
jgi:hypothetical protein